MLETRTVHIYIYIFVAVDFTCGYGLCHDKFHALSVANTVKIRVSAVKCAGLHVWPSSVDINLAKSVQVF